jgi:hypothetical protein
VAICRRCRTQECCVQKRTRQRGSRRSHGHRA